jgi:hypothetical protein
MKADLKSNLLVELTAQESAAINGGKHGEDDYYKREKEVEKEYKAPKYYYYY